MAQYENLGLSKIQLERDLILYLVSSQSEIVELVDKVSMGTFEDSYCKRIFGIAKKAYIAKKGFGRSSILAKLGDKEDLDWLKSGGSGISNRKEMLTIVEELVFLAEKRRIYKLADKLQEELIGNKDLNIVISNLVQGLTQGLEDSKNTPSGILEVLREEFERFQKGKKLSTGIKGLDEKLPHLVSGHIWIIGANTGGGKSFTALQIAKNVSLQGGKVVIFSTEMRNYENLGRMIGNELGQGYHSLWKPESGVNFFEGKDIEEFIKKIEKGLRIYDNCRTVEQIALVCRKLVMKSEVDVVIIDFFQNLDVRSKDSYEGFRKAAQEVQSLAKDLGITIILTSQLSNTFSKNVNTDNFRTPEYKNAGEIAASADVGLLLIDSSSEIVEKGIVLPEDWKPIKCLIAKSRHTYVRDFRIPLVLKYPSGEVTDMPNEYNWISSEKVVESILEDDRDFI